MTMPASAREGASQVGHRRRRHWTHQYGLEARCGEARFQGGFKHIARDASIFADQHLLGCPSWRAPCRRPRPSFITKSGVIGNSPTLPRTPSVPKYFLVIVCSRFFIWIRNLVPSCTIQPTRRASMVARTSCTRMILAPCCNPIRAQARLPASRSSTGRPSRSPIIDFRDIPHQERQTVI